MDRRWQLYPLLAALLLVEVTAYWKLAAFLSFTSERPLALLTALAFITLLLSSLVAMSQNIPDSMRTNVIRGGMLLLLVQGMANVLVSYQQGMTHLPADVVTRFFGISDELALKSTAIVSGATLSLVSIFSWRVIGELVHQRMEEVRLKQEHKDARQQTVFDELGAILSEAEKETQHVS